jgi:hypothetical protein
MYGDTVPEAVAHRVRRIRKRLRAQPLHPNSTLLGQPYVVPPLRFHRLQKPGLFGPEVENNRIGHLYGASFSKPGSGAENLLVSAIPLQFPVQIKTEEKNFAL